MDLSEVNERLLKRDARYNANLKEIHEKEGILIEMSSELKRLHNSYWDLTTGDTNENIIETEGRTEEELLEEEVENLEVKAAILKDKYGSVLCSIVSEMTGVSKSEENVIKHYFKAVGKAKEKANELLSNEERKNEFVRLMNKAGLTGAQWFLEIKKAKMSGTRTAFIDTEDKAIFSEKADILTEFYRK